MALTEKLTAIGDAIRAKTGGSEKLTLDQMPTEIEGIQTGGSIEVEPIVLTGNQEKACSGQIVAQYIKLFGNTISTNKLTDTDDMFSGYTGEYIPFDLNYDTANWSSVMNVFQNCKNLKELPKMLNTYPTNHLINLFAGCNNLRYIPDDYFDTWNFSKIKSETSSFMRSSTMFQSCYSLRSMPLAWMKDLHPKASNTSSVYYGGFTGCYCLDEIVNLPIPYTTVTWTSNAFSQAFDSCSRLKRLTFETNEDGTPIVVQWKAQTIDLSGYIGFFSATTPNLYNSGITADKKVTMPEEYEALKNDPDWYAVNYYYSRYNHDSAVETINSLPDTSAYLAANGGTNTIKLKGACGSSTDGGAINTLTEEEIAVATAKGWTVSFV